MSALGSKSQGSVKAPAQSSSKLNTSVGSSSKPGGKSKHPIKTTAPADPHTMDRKPPSGWLK